MRTLLYSSIIFVLATIITGCAPRVSTHLTPSYADARTLMTLNQSAKIPIQVMQFTSSLKNDYKIRCLKSSIKTHFFASYSRLFYEAIRNDLHFVGLYHPYATKAALQGNLDKLYFDIGGFGQGYWYIQMTFYRKNDQGKWLTPFTLNTKHYFMLDNEDPHYCDQIAKDFPSAVRQFIKKLYNSKQFLQIITPSKH